jgi:hypothetical protein
MSDYHVFPVDDLIEHDTEGDCVCIPRVEAMTEGPGPTDWLYVHSSLDGRELKEEASK